MSEAIWIAIITAVAPILSVIVSHFLANKKFKKADVKLDHITVLTNSTLTAANKRIEVLETELERITKTLEGPHDVTPTL